MALIFAFALEKKQRRCRDELNFARWNHQKRNSLDCWTPEKGRRSAEEASRTPCCWTLCFSSRVGLYGYAAGDLFERWRSCIQNSLISWLLVRSYGRGISTSAAITDGLHVVSKALESALIQAWVVDYPSPWPVLLGWTLSTKSTQLWPFGSINQTLQALPERLWKPGLLIKS